MCRWLQRPLRARDPRGAGAVEFALVSLVLFPLLFGIIDFGLWFNDSLNTRQGVREGARRAVVQTVNPACTTGTSLDKYACDTQKAIGALAGKSWTKVLVPNGWAKGSQVVVCGVVQVKGVTGITPLPSDSIIRSKTAMSIEVASPVPSGSAATGSTSGTAGGSLPTGQDWNWCTL